MGWSQILSVAPLLFDHLSLLGFSNDVGGTVKQQRHKTPEMAAEKLHIHIPFETEKDDGLADSHEVFTLW